MLVRVRNKLREHVCDDVMIIIIEYLLQEPRLAGLCDRPPRLYLYGPDTRIGLCSSGVNLRWIITQSVVCYTDNYNLSNT